MAFKQNTPPSKKAGPHDAPQMGSKWKRRDTKDTLHNNGGKGDRQEPPKSHKTKLTPWQRNGPLADCNKNWRNEKRSKIVNRSKGCRDYLCIKDGIISLRERKPDNANMSLHHKPRTFIPTHSVCFTPARHSPNAHPSFSFFPRKFISDWGPNLHAAMDRCQRRTDGRNAGTEKQACQ